MRITLVALALVGCWRSTEPPPVQPVAPPPAAPVGGSGYGGTGYGTVANNGGCTPDTLGCNGRYGGGSYGGGGTGWGTIGTGRYGTIGHGSGTSSGNGVSGGGGLRVRTAAVPTMSIGQPSAQGDLDRAIIRRYIKRNQQRLLYCYEKQLLAKPGISGTVMVMFVIGTDGKVTKSDASGVDPDVASCVASVIRDIEFPKPTTPADVQVAYPFTFQPAGGP